MIDSLNENHVDYVLIGAYAMFAHGYRRATTDIDVLVPATRDAGDKIRLFSASTATSRIVSDVELRNPAVAADFTHSQEVCPQKPI